MRKAYVALLGSVLLVSIFVTVTTQGLHLADAATVDTIANNVIIAAINNATAYLTNTISGGVTTVLNAITNAQNNINAHTDADTNGLAPAPINLILNENITVEKNKALYIQLLNKTDGLVYSGHISMRVIGSQYIYVILDADLPGGFWNMPLRDTGLKSGEYMSVDFTSMGLRMTLDNTNMFNDEYMEIYAVIQYTVTTG